MLPARLCTAWVTAMHIYAALEGDGEHETGMLGRAIKCNRKIQGQWQEDEEVWKGRRRRSWLKKLIRLPIEG